MIKIQKLCALLLLIAVSAHASNFDIGSTLSISGHRNRKLTPLFVSATDQYAYIMSDHNHEIYICSVGTDGSLNSCSSTGITPPGGSGTWSPYAIAFGTFHGGEYAFVADQAQGIQRCQVGISTPGALSNCGLTGSLGSGFVGVSIATVGSNRYAYVSKGTSSATVSVCSLNNNGTFNSCSSAISSTPTHNTNPWQPFSISFATVGGTQYAYVADQQSGAWQCSINSGDGTFSSCVFIEIGGNDPWNTDNLAIATVNGTQYAYVMAYTGSSFYQCTVDPSGSPAGTLDSCSSPFSFSAPWSWARSIGFSTVSGTQYAYVADIIGHQIYQCGMDSTTGNLTSCSTTGPSSSDTTFEPRTITLAHFPLVHYTYSGTTSGHINYIQLCTATDSTCGTCNAPYATITSGTPISYSTSGTQYFINSAAIAQYLQRAGLSAGTYNIGMYLQSQELNCAAGAAYCGTDHDTAGSPHKLCMSATYDGVANVTSMTQSDSHTASLSSSTYQYAYIPSASSHELYVCSVQSSGALASCAEEGTAAPDEDGRWNPYAIAFGNINGTTYAYVADNSSSGVQQCNVSATNGALSNCSVISPTLPDPPPSLAPASGISIASVGNAQYAYVSVGNDVYRCTFNNDGTLLACIATPSSNPGWTPVKISFAYVGQTQYAYVADTSNGQWACTLNTTDGTFSSCSNTGVSNWSSNGQTIATVSGTQNAYVTGIGTDVIYQCTADAGAIDSCNIITHSSSWNLPRSTAFSTVSGITYAYVGDITGNQIVKCVLGNDGSFSACNGTAPTFDGASFRPRSTSIFNSFGYIASDSNHEVYYCVIDGNGEFTSCNSTNPSSTTPPGGSGTWSPYAIAFGNFSGSQYAYVADNSNGIQRCSMDISTGALSSCGLTGSLGSGVVGVTIATVGSNKYAYVSKAFSNIIDICSFNSDGTINSCSASSTFTGGGGSWQPFTVAFASSGGTQYAYVGDQQNGAWQCSLNTGDGTFSSCSYVSAAPINPINTDNLTIYTTNGTQYAYLGAYGGKLVYKCALDASGSPAGTLDSCVPLNYPVAGSNPRAIDVATVAGTQYVYSADYSGNQLFQCPISNFSSCSTTAPTSSPVDTSFQPTGVTVTYLRN